MFLFFQASWAVSPFLASLEQKRNTFCEHWNVKYNYIVWKLRNCQKICSSNCSNLKARMNFLKISKPVENWWGTPFWGNSSWGALLLSSWIFKRIPTLDNGFPIILFALNTWCLYFLSIIKCRSVKITLSGNKFLSKIRSCLWRLHLKLYS